MFGAMPSATGITVSEKNAISVTAVYAAVRILASTMASLPLPMYRKLVPRGKERAADHPLYFILHDQANSEMTAFQFRELLMFCLLLWGNFFAYIERNRGGQIIALWPLLPYNVNQIRDSDGTLWYIVTLLSGEQRKLPMSQVLHIAGMSENGLSGLNPIRTCREAIALALGLEQYSATFLGNGAQVGGVYEVPGKLSDAAYKRLKESLASAHTGLTNAHKTMILEEGMKFTQTAVDPEKAQALEGRKFQVDEVSRITGVPPHLLANLERATFSNIEHQGLEFAIYCIRPWAVRIEQRLNMQLLTESERKQYFFEHLIDGLYRGDQQARAEYYSKAINNGWMCPDEVREIENMNPMPDGQGQIYRMPVNTIPANLAADFWLAKGGDKVGQKGNQNISV